VARRYVDILTSDNWRTSRRARSHAGMVMGCYIEQEGDRFIGVWGIPGTLGFTVRCATLSEALAWANRSPQPFVTLEIDAAGARSTVVDPARPEGQTR
jgi:hypothetical protein